MKIFPQMSEIFPILVIGFKKWKKLFSLPADTGHGKPLAFGFFLIADNSSLLNQFNKASFLCL